MSFMGKVVVVTGAGNGIGRSVAQAYVAKGAKVVLADVDEAAGQTAVQEIEQRGGTSFFYKADVRSPEQIEQLMEAAVRRYGSLDILINNAGVSRWKSPYELNVEEWDDILDINLRGIFLCAREAAKRMKEQGGGAIVNLASTRALMSEPNTEAYAASKGGILALTHALAISLGPDGIRVNAVSPGWIETGDYGQLRPADHAQHPAGRVGRPEDVARACLFLTHPENDFLTGENLVLDGGMTRKMIYEP